MAHLNISLFGYPAIELDETPVAVDERKAVALLAYLAASGTPQSREALGAFLWPEHDQAQSYASLRHALWSLKHAGLAAWLETGRDAVALRSGYRLDVAEFQQAQQARQFDAAAALYRADFLAGFTLRDAPAFDEWQFFQAEHLRQALAAALQQLVAEHCDRGDYQPGIAYARRWLTLDPLHEPAHRQLMQLYAWAGQQTAALRQYQECARLLREELGSAPEDETTALFETIRARKLVSPALLAERSATPAPLGNLPRPLTSFIGRAQEIAVVMRLLATSTSQLVTLTGSGGCGKTRLALQVGLALPAAYPQGMWFVELAPLADPALVPQAVATSLGVREEPGRPILATLVDFLRARKALLILDNCEHLIDGCARLAESLLHACVEVHILATSREALGIAGETVFRVPSLSIPDPQQSASADALLQYEAVRLFVERAATALPGFTVTGDNAAALARICRRLDGIPLAIELAAARVTALRVEQIDARLVETFDLLTGGSRTALPRQHTLRATMEWSYALLSEAERVLLRRLAVFAGGWTLEAAEVVCRGQGTGDRLQEEHEVSTAPLSPVPYHLSPLDGLAALVNKSLVIVEREQGEEARYRLLETIREYALERLDGSGEAERIQQQHAAYYLVLAEAAAPQLRGADQLAGLKQLTVEHNNLRAALRWFGTCGEAELSLRLGAALARFWDRRGHLSEGRRWLEGTLGGSTEVSAAVRAAALLGAAWLAYNQGDFARAMAMGQESLTLSRALDDMRGIADALRFLGFATRVQGEYQQAPVLLEESLARYQALGMRVEIADLLTILAYAAWDQGDYGQAQRCFEESLAIFREQGDKWGTAWALAGLGYVAHEQRDNKQATAIGQESLALFRELEDPTGIAFVLQFLGHIALAQADYGHAVALLAESLALRWELDDQSGIASCLFEFANAAVAQQQLERAARLFGAAESRSEALGMYVDTAFRADYERGMAAVRAQLDEATIETARAEGRAMTLEQAVAEALELRAVDAEKPAQAVAPSRNGG